MPRYGKKSCESAVGAVPKAQVQRAVRSRNLRRTTEQKTKLSLQAEAERIKKTAIPTKAGGEVRNVEATGEQIWENAVHLAQPEHGPPPTLHNNFEMYQKWVGEQ